MTSVIAQAYDSAVLRHPKTLLAVLLAVLVFFGYYTKDFKLDASADSLLLEDDTDFLTLQKIQARSNSVESSRKSPASTRCSPSSTPLC